MATEERRNRVYKALHKPLLIFGIERKIFGGIVAVAYLMHYATRSFLAAVCTFVLGAIIGYIVTKKDPIYFQVLMQSFKFKTVYDAAKHEMPKVEIHSNVEPRKDRQALAGIRVIERADEPLRLVVSSFLCKRSS